MSYIDGGSFMFGGVDMYETYGLQLYDVLKDELKPKIRKNTLTIPHRNGVVDFGARWYDQRNLTLRCITTLPLTRAQVREIAYTLSQKNQLILWNEPDKYYVGQIISAPALDYEVNVWWTFDLKFVCDPFAYGQQVTQTFTNSSDWDYGGSATAPTVITITNNNDYPITDIEITIREVMQS